MRLISAGSLVRAQSGPPNNTMLKDVLEVALNAATEVVKGYFVEKVVDKSKRIEKRLNDWQVIAVVGVLLAAIFMFFWFFLK